MPLSLEEFPAATYEEWRAAAEESLKGAPFDKKLLSKTAEGITLQPIYRREDLEKLDLSESWPGLAPFTRGANVSGFKGTSWLIAQELPYGSPEAFNAALKSDLMRGQNATAIVPDTATRLGFDPDQAAVGDVAQCGVSLATRADAASALAGIDLQAAPVLAFAGATGLPLAALLASASGPDAISGSILADPLTEWARDGSLPLSLADAYSEMAALTRWGAEKKIRTLGIQACLWADAGGNAVQELAFGIATGSEYLRAMGEAGLDANTAAPRFVMALSLGSNLFVQIAKLRAARLLWSKITESFGAAPTALFIHARSSIFNKSTLDPHTNILRATAEAFAGVIGGADSLHVAAFDECLRTPDEISRRIARNVHTILAEECGFSEVADAAGGSWFVESLTVELAQKAWSLFQEIEKLGGMAAALREGFPQAAIEKSAASHFAAVSSRRESILGVNLFPNASEVPLPVGPFDSTSLHAERVHAVSAVRKPLSPSVEPTVESLTEAFASGATLGQITAALPRTGTPEAPIARIRVVRAATGYEALRAATRKNPPRVWLAKFGPPKQSKARADFSSGFFEAGGYEVLQGPTGAKTPEDALAQAIHASPTIVVVCSTDDSYPEIVPAFVPLVKQALSDAKIFLAGFPADQIEAHKAAGIDDFIHLKVDCLAFLKNLNTELGLS